MRRLLAGLTAATFVLAMAAPVFADTVRGQLVDQACYKMDPKANVGVNHVMKSGPVTDCAIACAKKGSPVALVTAKGEVYQVTGDIAAEMNKALVGHMSHTVELTGDVTKEKDGSMKLAVGTTGLKMISR